MPKTRNFSNREKREAMDMLNIHNDINAVHLLTGIHPRTLRRWRKKLRRRQNATLSEKSISLSAKRTMSDKVITRKQPPDNTAPTPNAAIQPPANAPRKNANTANNDLQSLLYIRAQLMRFACRLAGDLDPDDPDVNLRTLSLSRTLDRIYWLDDNLYDGEDQEEASQPDPPNRARLIYDGKAREHPPWHDPSEEEPRPNPSNPKSPPAQDDAPNRIEFNKADNPRHLPPGPTPPKEDGD